MFREKKRNRPNEIPTSSLADIAFLLLIFFLVTTTIDMDKGLSIVLPPKGETKEVSKKNITNILVNAAGDCLIDNEEVPIGLIKEIIKTKLSLNDKLIVSIKTDEKTKYEVFIDVLDRVKQSYTELRDQYSRQKFGKKFLYLKKNQQKEVRKAVPVRISLAEPGT